MGSLQSISSVGLVIMPLVGTLLLGAASHLPPHDWRVGGPFFLCAAMLAAALLVARHYFRRHRLATTTAAEQALRRMPIRGQSTFSGYCLPNIGTRSDPGF